jgi:hypothetical protein
MPKCYDEPSAEKKKEPEKKELKPEEKKEPEKKELIIFPQIETLADLLKKDYLLDTVIFENKDQPAADLVERSSTFKLTDMEREAETKNEVPQTEAASKTNETAEVIEPPVPTPPTAIEKALSEISLSAEKKAPEKPKQSASVASKNNNYKDPYRELPL